MMPDPFYPVMPDVTWLERVVGGGARFVQLRMKDGDAGQRTHGARRARDFCTAAGATLVLNDYWELALAEKIDFVHLGQEDLAGTDVLALRRAGVRIGVSTHDEAELDRALAIRPDYIALGPVYATRLKVMPWSPQGLDKLIVWKRRIGAIPLVAIGGITVARIAPVLGAGADCVAVVTDIVTAGDPDRRIRDWREATRG